MHVDSRRAGEQDSRTAGQQDSRTPVLVNTDFHWAEFQETPECTQIAAHIPCTKLYPHWKKNVESMGRTARKPKTAVRFCCTALQ